MILGNLSLKPASPIIRVKKGKGPEVVAPAPAAAPPKRAPRPYAAFFQAEAPEVVEPEAPEAADRESDSDAMESDTDTNASSTDDEMLAPAEAPQQDPDIIDEEPLHTMRLRDGEPLTEKRFWDIIAQFHWSHKSDEGPDPVQMVHRILPSLHPSVAREFYVEVRRYIDLAHQRIREQNLFPKNLTLDQEKSIASHFVGMGREWFRNIRAIGDVIQFIIEAGDCRDFAACF